MISVKLAIRIVNVRGLELPAEAEYETEELAELARRQRIALADLDYVSRELERLGLGLGLGLGLKEEI